MDTFEHMNIWIVDDDPNIISLMRHWLTKCNFKNVQSATDPTAALPQIFAAPPDLIVLDIVMPEIDGYEFCKRLRLNAATQSIPVIMITGGGLDADETVTRAFDAGATDYITKPVRTAEFMARIRSALSLKQAHDCLRYELEERRRIEREQLKLLSAVQQAHDLIKILGTDGTIQYVNPAAERLIGYSAQDLLGQNPFQHKRSENDALYYELWETISRGRIWSGRQTNLRRDNSRIELEVIISPILDHAQNVMNFLSISRDITKEVKLEHKLDQARKMEAIGTLAGGVAHDLNNILSGIVSYPDLLLMRLPEDSPLRAPVESIKETGRKAAAIVQDLLTLARRGVVTREVVSLNNIVQQYLITPEFNKLKRFHSNVRITGNLSHDLLNVEGSELHLSKTVMNLVSNATEAIGPGKGEVIISTANCYLDRPMEDLAPLKEGEYVLLSIADTGVGMNDEEKAKIFDPFYTKKVMGRSGTGLGMAVVWGTVQDHHGYITIESQPGEGTTITIFFPASRKPLSRKTKPVSKEEYMGCGESILVVDDIPLQREIAEAILIELGYETETAESGEKAITYLQNHTADLVVLDMIMEPGIDGFETYSHILEHTPRQRAIIVSGYAETPRVKQTLALGAGRYVKKPYTLEKLGMAIKAELAAARSEKALSTESAADV